MPAYGDWRDVYCSAWTWDSIHKGTHHVNCWYQRGCNWNVYVKDGLVLREEQAATYEQTNVDVPDFNPRGCQKGACYSSRLYDAARLRYPLKRVGERGAGKWKRLSWSEALGEVADLVIDVLTHDGPESIVWDQGTANTSGCNGVGLHRTAFVLDTPILNVNCEVGDHHPGALTTLGKISFSGSADEVFYSDLILVWGGNPVCTQIPNAHFLTKARYRGARIVCIAPDLSASAVHADEWIPIRPGTDAALGLAIAHVIIAENRLDRAFVTEQTDLPLLVRTDTQKLLRQQDMETGGADDVFYVWDEASGLPREAGRKSLAQGKVRPALEGRFRVETAGGGAVEVATVLTLLAEHLAAYTPETAQQTTGVAANMIVRLAHSIASAHAAHLVTQSNFSKYYHGLEMERAQILVMALCGHVGKKGAGISVFPAMTIAGASSALVSSGSLAPRAGALLLAAKTAPRFLAGKWNGLTDEMILRDLAAEECKSGRYLSGVLYHYLSSGLGALYGGSARWDPELRRDVDDYLEEALRAGWQTAPPQRTRIFFEAGGNILRRTRGYDRLYQTFLPRLGALVTIDWRMSNTALHSDYVFPAAAWYEKDDITWATPLAPFGHPTTQASEPFMESKSDWEFHCLLLGEIQRRARNRRLKTFTDRSGRKRRLDRVYDVFTFGRRFTEANPRALLDELLHLTTNLDDTTWPELASKGYARYTSLGIDFINTPNATDIRPGETITAGTWHTEKKMPWPTLTRRIQFYIDHPFYLEFCEQLPMHKDPPPIGGNYPLMLTGQHTRWSIHASWRDDAALLQLQRGEPFVVLSHADAVARGLADGDVVEVFNDVGRFQAVVKRAATVRPGQVVIDHAWEPFQFRGRSSHQAAIPAPINPLQLAGGYFHLLTTPVSGQPGSPDRATRVEVRPLSA